MDDTWESDQENRERVWQHAIHEDNLFNDRLNFFLVFQSVLMGVTGVLLSTVSPNRLLITAIIIIGIVMTALWAIAQGRQKHQIEILEHMIEKLPSYKAYLEQLRGPKGRRFFSGTWFLSYFTPILIGILWVILLIY